MHDEEFEKIEHEYRKYVIAKLHDPKEWEEELDFVQKELDEEIKRKGASPDSSPF